MLARAAVRSTGACAEGSHKDGEQLVGRLREMLEEGNLERYREAARRFAQKYARLDEAEQVGRMVGRVEDLVAGRHGDKETRGQGGEGRGGAEEGVCGVTQDQRGPSCLWPHIGVANG
jgi:hypothetical protein